MNEKELKGFGMIEQKELTPSNANLSSPRYSRSVLKLKGHHNQTVRRQAKLGVQHLGGQGSKLSAAELL